MSFSFAFLKCMVPTLKNNPLLFGQHERYPLPMPLPTTTLINHTRYEDQYNHLPEIILPGRLPLPLQETEGKAQDEEETCKSTCSLPQSDQQLQRNLIDNRVKHTQYQANNPCEDTLACDQLKSLDAYAISVFDGHGGPELAEYCRSKIHHFMDSYLSEQLWKFSCVGQAIKESLRWSYQRTEDSFFQVYQQQLKMGNKRIRSVGSCAITAVVHNDTVYLANSGDSQAVFLLADAQGVRSVKANDRLSVNSRSERERLRKEWTAVDSEIITEEGGAYYLKGRLQPTRTIGDYYLKKEQHYQGPGAFQGPYLSCLPDILQHKLTPAHRYLVVASDGVWDALSKNQVSKALIEQPQIDLSKTCHDLQQQKAPYLSKVVGSILQRASEVSGVSIQQLRAMQRGVRRNYHDDITLAVVDLQQQL